MYSVVILFWIFRQSFTRNRFTMCIDLLWPSDFDFIISFCTARNERPIFSMHLVDFFSFFFLPYKIITLAQSCLSGLFNYIRIL